MDTQYTPQSALEDIKINVKLKLASLWASLMFLYIYIDNFHFYMLNKIADIQKGRVFEFDIIPRLIIK